MARGAVSSSNYFEDESAQITSGVISLSIWFYVPAGVSPSNFGELIAVEKRNTWSFHGWVLECNDASGDHVITARTYEAGSATIATANGGWSDDTWTHVLAAFNSDGSDVRIFVDGVSFATTTGGTARTPSGVNTVAIGAASHNGHQSPLCHLAEGAVYAAELTVTEAAQLAAGVSPVFVRPDALRHYYPLFESNAGGVPDRLNASNAGELGTVGGFAHPPIIYSAPKYYWSSPSAAPSGIAATSVETVWHADDAGLNKHTLIACGVAETAWQADDAALNKHAAISASDVETAYQSDDAALNKHTLIAAASAETAWSGETATIPTGISAGVVESAWQADGAALNKHTAISAADAETALEPAGASLNAHTAVAAADAETAFEASSANLNKHTAITAGSAETAWEAQGAQVGGALLAGVAETAFEPAAASLNKHAAIAAASAESALETGAASLNKHTKITGGVAETAWQADSAAIGAAIAANSVDSAWQADAASLNKHTLVAAGVAETAWQADSATIQRGIAAGVAETAWQTYAATLVAAPPDVPGVEWAVADEKAHWSINTSRAHWTI